MNNIEENSEKQENKYFSFIKKNKYRIAIVFLSITTTLLLILTISFNIKATIFENRYKAEEIERIKITEEKNNLATEYTAYKTKMKKFEELSEAEAKQKLDELEKKQQEEKEKIEAEAKKGYDSGITYDQLAREPKNYIGKKIKFSGKVLQVTKEDSIISIRLAVDGDYKKVILVNYAPSIVSKNVLEDDQITVSGLSAGEISYTATSGAKITIPGMVANYIDFN